MARKIVRVRSFNPDGTLTLDTGETWQAVINEQGALGARPITDRDRLAGLDQPVQLAGNIDQADSAPSLPSIASLGLDQ